MYVEEDSFLKYSTFIARTDQYNLFNKIKGLIDKAKEVKQRELDERRNSLKELLDYEDSIFESEFSNNVKSRIDREIQERKDALVQIREQNRLHSEKLLNRKVLKEGMLTCTEVREALRRKDLMVTKLCQKEQIVENERKKAREKERDKYWHQMLQAKLANEDMQQAMEDRLIEQKKLAGQCNIKLQLQELEAVRKAEHEQKIRDAAEMKLLREALHREQIEKSITKGITPKMKQYGQELRDTIAKRQQRRCEEDKRRAEDHFLIMLHSGEAEAEEKAAAEQRKRCEKQETAKYLAYVKGLRQLQLDQQRLRDERIADLQHVDYCTKTNLLEQQRLRDEETAKVKCELERQICADLKRRQQEEIERREPKIIVNYFVQSEMDRGDVLEKLRKNRADLEKQIQENELKRAEERKQYLQEDTTVSVERDKACQALMALVETENVDYLSPHPNWKIIACSNKTFGPKPPSIVEGEDHAVVAKRNPSKLANVAECDAEGMDTGPKLGRKMKNYLPWNTCIESANK